MSVITCSCKGTLMGFPSAPSYANIFMAKIELEILKGPYSSKIVTWMRFVDNIFVLWAGTAKELDAFESSINHIHPLLQSSMTKDQDEIFFLNVRVLKKDECLHTTLYTKPADRNNLLRWDSHHSPQTLKGIPRGQFMRARKICSDDIEYHKHKQTLIEKFVAKGTQELGMK